MFLSSFLFCAITLPSLKTASKAVSPGNIFATLSSSEPGPKNSISEYSSISFLGVSSSPESKWEVLKVSKKLILGPTLDSLSLSFKSWGLNFGFIP